jgi:recombinational DNA repair protein (RecF pathway)
MRAKILFFVAALICAHSAVADPATETIADYAAKSKTTRLAYSQMMANLLRENHADLTADYLFKCLDDTASYPNNQKLLLRAAVIGCVNWPH